MTRWEMLNALSTTGDIAGSDFHDGLEGWFGWTVTFSNGSAVLTVRFEDIHTREVFEYEWTLDAKETNA